MTPQIKSELNKFDAGSARELLDLRKEHKVVRAPKGKLPEKKVDHPEFPGSLVRLCLL